MKTSNSVKFSLAANLRLARRFRFALVLLLPTVGTALVGFALIASHKKAGPARSFKQVAAAHERDDGDAVHLPGVPPRGPETIFYRNRSSTATPLTGINNNGGNGYAGLNYTFSGGYVPPDSCGAAGPSSYVETVNQELAIYSPKSTGAHATSDDLGDFFFWVGGITPIYGANPGLSDPIVIYDELIGRFIVGDQDTDLNACGSQFMLAVSKTSNPTTLTAADWNFYSIDTTGNCNFADYPGNFGYNADALVFTLNMLDLTGSGNDYVLVTTVSAADLAAGVSQSLLHTYQSSFGGTASRDLSVRPTTMHGSVAGDPMWFVTEHGNNYSVDVIKMTNVLSFAPTFTTTNLFVNQYVAVASPRNPDGTIITTNIDSRILKAAEANNTLVATQTVGVSTIQDAARWYVIDVSSGTPILSQQSQIAAGNHTYITYPAIDINSSGFIGMTYMRSGTDTASDYMSMYVTGRAPGAPAGTMQTPVLVPAGTGQTNYSDFANPHRAGDLSGINIDPVDGSFWAASEFATTTAGQQSQANWGTAIANFNAAPLLALNSATSFAYHFSPPNPPLPPTVIPFEINLPLSGNPGIECRDGDVGAAGGGTPGRHNIFFYFNNHIASTADASVSCGTVTFRGSNGNPISVEFDGSACNGQYVTVTLTGIQDDYGQPLASASVIVGLLVGDTTGDGTVNSSDVSQTKARSGQAIGANSFRSDVNIDTSLNSSDVSQVKAASGTALPAPPSSSRPEPKKKRTR